MTHEITGANTWRATITSPVTGEAVNQAAWDNPVQDLADSVMYLYTTGGGRIPTVADSTALKALTGMAAGDLRAILSSGRIYQFVAGTPAPSASNWGAYAYDANDASGHWLCTQPTGIEMIERQHVAVDDIDTTVGAYMAITGDTNFHILTNGVTPMTITLAEDLIEDDIVEVTSHFGAAGDGASTGVFEAVVNFDSTNHTVDGSGCYSGGGTDNYTMNCSGTYVVPPGGATGVTVSILGKVSNGANTLTVGDTSVYLSVKVYRAAP